MAVAALIAWIVTALGGFYLLATWIQKGGHRRTAGALLGFGMLLRWLPAYRGRVSTGGRVAEALVGGPAERHFPVGVVAGHGLLAVTTVVLVLLAAAGVGS